MLDFYVIYFSPLDYPGKYVVRRQVATPNGVIPDAEPLAVVKTLIAPRAALPALGLHNIGRDPEDEPQIVESWI